MKKIVILLYLSLFVSIIKAQTVWSIGQKNNSAAEFALAPDKYHDFLKNDFGWENKSYVIGFSSPQADFPYILPGPADQWGGTGGLSGIRTHVFNILFKMPEMPDNTNFKFVIDLLDTQGEIPPLFKVIVNNRSFYYKLPPGGTDVSLTGDFTNAKKHTIEIPVSTLIRKGGNTISLSSIEGSWIIFDAIRLISSKPLKYQPVNKVFVRSISVAEYETAHPDAQPLLVDVEHLKGHPELTVKLDNKTILSQKLETGRYVFEAPMPVVK
ncbi:MAG: polysaccharide lyase family protein, partial [Bacteroidia bacterium]|nr:polysaccharide lyase family protein [Bacteroidia bacterium]